MQIRTIESKYSITVTKFTKNINAINQDEVNKPNWLQAVVC